MRYWIGEIKRWPDIMKAAAILVILIFLNLEYVVKKVQPSLLDREESRFCSKFKTSVWGSGANLYMGLGGIIQEFLQFFRKFKL